MLDAALVNARFSGVSLGATTIASTAVIAAIVLVATLRALHGEISVGMLIAVIGVTQNLTGLLTGLSSEVLWSSSIFASARRVAALLQDLGRDLREPALFLEALATTRDHRGDESAAGIPRPAAGGLHLEQITSGSLHGLDLAVPDGAIMAALCLDSADEQTLFEVLTPGLTQQHEQGDEKGQVQAQEHGEKQDLDERHAQEVRVGAGRSPRRPAPRFAPISWWSRIAWIFSTAPCASSSKPVPRPP